MAGDGPALVLGRRGAGKTQADATVGSRGHQHKRKHPAGKRLGLVAVFLVNPATALFAQEDATAILAVIELIVPRPPGAALEEDRQAADLGILFPALGFDSPALLVRNRDDIFLAAIAANMAVPVLPDLQVTDGKRHGYLVRATACTQAVPRARQHCLSTSSGTVCPEFITGVKLPILLRPLPLVYLENARRAAGCEQLKSW